MTYRAYLNGNKVADELTKPTHKFTGLAPNEEYTVQFSKVDNGVESDLSEALHVTTKSATVLPDGVKLNKATLYLLENGSEKLEATVTPSEATDKKVTWSTNAKAVATVSTAGLVKAVGEGEAEITVTTSNGKTAKCTVHVTKPVIDVESVKIDQTSKTVKVGHREDLTATVNPDNATNRDLYWETDNKEVADVTAYTGGLEAKSPGKAVITVTAGGKTDSITITVEEGE